MRFSAYATIYPTRRVECVRIVGVAAEVARENLPGCMSDGDTREEASRNVEDAIASWLDEARAIGRAGVTIARITLRCAARSPQAPP